MKFSSMKMPEKKKKMPAKEEAADTSMEDIFGSDEDMPEESDAEESEAPEMEMGEEEKAPELEMLSDEDLIAEMKKRGLKL